MHSAQQTLYCYLRNSDAKALAWAENDDVFAFFLMDVL